VRPSHAFTFVFVATFACARSARAEDATSPSGVALFVHAGYEVLAGHEYDAASGVSDPMRSGTLVGGGVGWHFSRAIAVSVWAEYAAGSVASNLAQCAPGGCSAHDVHAGVELTWRLAPGALVDPWIGGAVGYGWTVVDYPSTVGPTGATLSAAGSTLLTAPIPARIELGADVAFDPSFGVGPWAALTLETPGDASGTTAHAWLALGLRGTFAP
jgi:hypothetical protein